MTIITSGTITGQSIDILSGSMDGTLETSAQPNITSVGNLSNLVVSGAMNANSLSVTTDIITNDVIAGGLIQSNALITTVGVTCGGDLQVTGKINGIQNVFTENVGGSTKSSTTTFISGNPDSSTIIGGKIITQDDGDTTQKEFKLSCGEGSRERSIVIQENQPVLINTDLAVYSELSCAELQVDNLIKLGVDSGNAGEVLTSNGSNNPTWSAIPPITAIDNIIIGANTPAAGSFTNLTSTGTTNINAVLNVSNTIKQQERVLNTFSYFGNCVLGNVRQQTNANTPEAGFSHRNYIGWDRFALMQDNNGNTHLNAKPGEDGGYVAIRLGWATKMSFTRYYTYSYSHFLPGYFGNRDLGSASYKWRTVYATVTSISSDDRLKINERPITDALELISNLNYYEYERVEKLDGKDAVGTDRGVIAQQLLNTDISFAVLGGGTEEIEEFDKDENIIIKKTVEVPYSVNYNILLATSLQAIKDLNVVVSDLRERLIKLENK